MLACSPVQRYTNCVSTARSGGPRSNHLISICHHLAGTCMLTFGLGQQGWTISCLFAPPQASLVGDAKQGLVKPKRMVRGARGQGESTLMYLPWAVCPREKGGNGPGCGERPVTVITPSCLCSSPNALNFLSWGAFYQVSTGT